jgi:hypothetical protein
MILHPFANKSLWYPKKCGPRNSTNKVAIGNSIPSTSFCKINLLSLKNADPELRKWCGAAGNMILHPFANKSLSYPEKMWACNSANGMALGIGSSTLPINEFYYP